ncbi:MAG: Chromosome-partitioning protein Spo0J [Parcubacteria group bacterium ADurb.Bin216]|nr:MAG: Chromosome-partitioning protein Spo0J [Parcubacteria group bacterium ADurb.Bin216]
MSIVLKVVPLSSIVFGERFREDYGDMSTLITSIKKEGLIQPLAVKDNGDGTYTLLAGGRRYKACTLAEIVEVPVRVYPDTLTDMEMRCIELMENVARKDLSWIEATNLNKRIFELQEAIHGRKVSTAPDAPGVSKRDVAELLGQSKTSFIDDLNLAKALESFPELKEAKTKSDAMKMFKRLQEEVVLSEIAKRVNNKQASTPIAIQKKELMESYIVGNFFDMIKKIPNNAVDIVEVDPPYAIELNQKRESLLGVNTNASHYNEVDAKEYKTFLKELFKECYRIMSSNSWIICWYAPEPWAEVVHSLMREAGFEGNRIGGIWYKENASGQSMQPDKCLSNIYEPFYYMRKGSPALSKQGRANVFAFKPVTAAKKSHPTERPIELMEEILRTFAWEGCRLCIPFMGSGNTRLAASNLGISGFGYDLSSEYKDKYILRVEAGNIGNFKSYKED